MLRIQFLTEIPRKRTLKKGQALGRQAMYRDFAVVQVDDSTSSRTTKEWRQRGAQTIFAEAMQNQRKQLFTPAAYTPNASVIPDLTFLTSVAGLNTVSGHESAASAVRETDAIADGVMRQVAAELGILNSAELLRLRERVRVAPKYADSPPILPVTRLIFDCIAQRITEKGPGHQQCAGCRPEEAHQLWWN